MKIKGKKLLSAFGVLMISTLGMYAQDSAETSLTMDLTLKKAIDIALAENPTIRVADKDIALKNVADMEAWMSLLPTLDASLTFQHSITIAPIKMMGQEIKMGSDGTSTATGGATLALPIFAPAVYQNMKLTKEDIKLAQEKARSSRLDLINQVSKAYYAALLAKSSLKVMEENYSVSKENFELVNNKYKVGKVSEYDKISAEVQMRSMNSALVSAETGVTLAQLKLKVLMGVTKNVGINFQDSLRAYEKDLKMPYVGSEEAELKDNSTLRQLDLNGNLLQRTRKLLYTNFMPTLGVQLTHQYSSYSNENWNIFKYKYNPATTFLVSLSIPIFHANYFTKLKSNKIQQLQLADTRINTERQLKMAVESYKQNMASCLAQIESNGQAVLQAQKAVQISNKRYDIGRGTILELNQSQTSYAQAELTYVQSIYDYLTNQADLDYTLGRETYLK